LEHWVHKTQVEDKQNKKYNTTWNKYAHVTVGVVPVTKYTPLPDVIAESRIVICQQQSIMDPGVEKPGSGTSSSLRRTPSFPEIQYL
jgi:hypothetical protein